MIAARLARLCHLVSRAFHLCRQDGTAETLRRVGQFLMTRPAVEPLGYRLWMLLYDRLTRRDRKSIGRHIERLADHPVISLLMTLGDVRPRDLRRTIQSVMNQLYPYWELCIAGEVANDRRIAGLLAGYAGKEGRIKVLPRAGCVVDADNAALSSAGGTFIAVVDPGDELSAQALYRVAVETNAHPQADIFYSDEDWIAGALGYARPFLKPDWSPDLFAGQNYIGRLCVMRRSLAIGAGGFRPGYEGCQDYDLLLRIIAGIAPGQIRHLPSILYHRRALPAVFPDSALAAARRALAEQFRQRGIAAEVDLTAGRQGYLRVRYPLPDPAPRVSIIIPTRDRLDLLRQCIQGLMFDTDYPDLEIIIVDNGSREPATLAYLAEIAKGPVRVLRDDGPFNYSALNNKAVAAASGSLVALLNNDTKVMHADWLREMVSQACRPEVGAVGAKLHFLDGSLQHAGVVLGLGGVAGHLHIGQPGTTLGHYDDVNLVRDVSCVTAACMLLRKAIFEEVGGLDEQRLPIALNDVDLCLKIRAKGYLILWTPFAALYHFESASRGLDVVSDKAAARFQKDLALMKERWGTALAADPYYNPNRTLDDFRGGLAFPPRVDSPWRLS